MAVIVTTHAAKRIAVAVARGTHRKLEYFLYSRNREQYFPVPPKKFPVIAKKFPIPGKTGNYAASL
jgi:hypothetical protein